MIQIIVFWFYFLSKKYLHLSVYYYHVTCTFQSKTTLYSFLNVKELFAVNRRDIWGLRDMNIIRIHNHLVHKQTLAKLAQIPLLWFTFISKFLSFGALVIFKNDFVWYLHFLFHFCYVFFLIFTLTVMGHHSPHYANR